MKLAPIVLASLLSAAPLSAGDSKQNWQFAKQFWTLDQGSKIMPWNWFMHLEKADGTGLLRDDLTRFGFIPGTLPETGLPIGLAKHQEGAVAWVGVTCAACHTGMWKVGTDTVQIEGGPSMLDPDSFAAAVLASLKKTVEDPDTFARFSQATQATRDDVAKLRDRAEQRVRINAHPVPAGFGRVDAFGTVFNQMTIIALGNDEKYSHAPMAPVSFPCLWDVAQQDRVQWNASAPNLGLEGDGSKLRNIGEALGVFADVQMSQDIGNPPKFPNSISKDGMVNAEHWIAQLASPTWPGTLDQQLVARGAQVYQSAKCATCHELLNDKNGHPAVTPIHLVSLDDIGTDRGQADQFRLNRVPTLKLSGKQKLVDPFHPLATFAPVDYSKDVTVYFFLAVFDQLFDPQLSDVLADFAKQLRSGQPNLAVYKARPLNGVWATAPYLHNGSVPNLWELLQRPESRSQRFCVGSRILDLRRVGYDPADQTAPCSVLDTSYIGNSNAGHTFGVDLSDSDKWALIEYLKSL